MQVSRSAADYGGTVPSRSLADDIRGRSDEELARLLVRRPDLARPAPADLTALAARASTRASVQRALDALDLAHLQAVEAVVVLDQPVSAASLTPALAGEVAGLLDELWTRALVWRGAGGLHVVRTVADVLGPHPAGLGPPAAELRGSTPPALRDAGQLRSLLDRVPPEAAAILDRLAWGPPLAVLPDAAPDGAGRVARGVAWLLEHHLLERVGDGQACLPREVGLALRHGRVVRDPRLHPPELGGRTVDAAAVDAAAGQQVSDLLVLVDELGAAWGPKPPRVLRSGGLAVRDLRGLARTLDVDEVRAAFVIELALAAGLVADDGGLEPVWAPTPAYDEWQQLPGAARWAALGTAWLASTRAAHLVGTTVPGGSGPVNAMGPEAQWPPVRGLRRDVLAVLETAGAGHAPEPQRVVEALRWRRPRRMPGEPDTVVVAVLREAEWLGVTGRGALSTAGRALLAGAAGESLAGVMHPHLPAPVRHILLQADLTAIAPGPLEGSLAQFMRLAADVESRGGATVYRLTPESVRRCLDSGWTADEILAALTDASQTPVPQPLDYLVRDVARRHGQTRVGGATAYIRSDDEATLTAMLADRSLSALQLRAIAPTVLVSPVDPGMVLDFLRDSSFGAVGEAADGVVRLAGTAPRRTAHRRRPAAPLVQALDDQAAVGLVAALRAGEETAAYQREQRDTRTGPPLPATDPTTTLAVLRDAAADRRGVWLGYSDAAGAVQRMLFYPDRVEGGRVHGTAEGSARTLSIHRVTGASAT